MVNFYKVCTEDRMSLFVGAFSGCGAEMTGFSIGEEDGGHFSGIWVLFIGGRGRMEGDGVGRCVGGGAVEGIALVCTT